MNRPYLKGGVLIFLFHFPLLYFGKDSIIITNDVLDLFFPNIKALLYNDALFSFAFFKEIKNVIGGIPLIYFDFPFYLNKIFFSIDIFYGYVINSFFVRAIGFVGVFKLGLNYFKTNKKLLFLISLSYSFLPVYTIYGLTILGLPYLLNSFILICKKEASFSNYFYIIIFPFLCIFQLTIPFVVVFVLFWIFYNKLQTKSFFVWLSIFSFSSIISISPLLYSFLINTSNRGNRIFELTPSFSGGFFLTLKTIFFGELTSSLFISFPVILILTFTLKKYSQKEVKLILCLILVIISSSVFYSFYPSISNFISRYLSFFNSFNFGRFYFLNSFIFYLIILIISKKSSFFLRNILITILFLNLIRSMDFFYNSIARGFDKKYYDIIYSEDYLKKLFNKKKFVQLNTTGLLTFNEYYSTELFENIKNHIDLNKSVIHLGLNPGVSIYNGINSFDGYFPFFPEDKELTMNMINKMNIKGKNSLEIVPRNKKHNCYNCTDLNTIKYRDLGLDYSILRNKGVGYLISAFNVTDNNLKFIRSFKDINSPYRLFLYELK